jgi:hypothetical protein
MAPARCQFCRRSDGSLVAGEPRRVGIRRGSTSYRMVTPYWHTSCLEAERKFNEASRARTDAEMREGLAETMRAQGWSEEQIAAVFAGKTA